MKRQKDRIFIFPLAVLFALLGCILCFAGWCGRAAVLLLLAALER